MAAKRNSSSSQDSSFAHESSMTYDDPDQAADELDAIFYFMHRRYSDGDELIQPQLSSLFIHRLEVIFSAEVNSLIVEKKPFKNTIDILAPLVEKDREEERRIFLHNQYATTLIRCQAEAIKSVRKMLIGILGDQGRQSLLEQFTDLRRGRTEHKGSAGAHAASATNAASATAMDAADVADAEQAVAGAAVPARLRVLVVDDEPFFTEQVEQELRELDVDLMVTNDPREVLEALQQGPTSFDVLITDCNMPHHKGAALIEQLKQSALKERGGGRLKRGPWAIMMSADDSNRGEAAQFGADRFVNKCEPDFAEMISHWVRGFAGSKD